MFFLQSSLLSSKDDKIKHYFFTRLGGISDGSYDSLNCSISSLDDKVSHNIKIVCNSIDFEYNKLKMVQQSHSNKVITVADNNLQTIDQKADALVSNSPGILLAVYTADCVPIIFQDKINGIIGIAHAGWRGALSGIISNTVLAMKELGAKSIKAALGPCIGQKNYEIDQKFYHDFINHDINTKSFFIVSSREGHYLFNLPRYCLYLLENTQIVSQDCKIDTYSNNELFFSYRRSYHEALKNNQSVRHGCQLSAVGISR